MGLSAGTRGAPGLLLCCRDTLVPFILCYASSGFHRLARQSLTLSVCPSPQCLASILGSVAARTHHLPSQPLSLMGIRFAVLEAEISISSPGHFINS